MVSRISEILSGGLLYPSLPLLKVKLFFFFFLVTLFLSPEILRERESTIQNRNVKSKTLEISKWKRGRNSKQVQECLYYLVGEYFSLSCSCS